MRNQLGTAADPALQGGVYNKLTLIPTGSDNAVGTRGTGLDQAQGADKDVIPAACNRTTITQGSDANILGEVSLIIDGMTPQGANTLNVTQQGGSGNRIGAIHQRQFSGMPGQSAW